jgi:hypothetical protein
VHILLIEVGTDRQPARQRRLEDELSEQHAQRLIVVATSVMSHGRRGLLQRFEVFPLCRADLRWGAERLATAAEAADVPLPVGVEQLGWRKKLDAPGGRPWWSHRTTRRWRHDRARVDYGLSRSLLGMSYHDLERETRRLKRANRKLEKTIRRLAEVNSDGTEFALHNSPAAKKPWRGSVPENTRQTVLLAGMDCCQGQRDLFETDGEAAQER